MTAEPDFQEPTTGAAEVADQDAAEATDTADEAADAGDDDSGN